MLSREGRRFMEQAPWLAFWPGLCLTAVVYSLNMFGDAMRDLLDPRLRGASAPRRRLGAGGSGDRHTRHALGVARLSTLKNAGPMHRRRTYKRLFVPIDFPRVIAQDLLRAFVVPTGDWPVEEVNFATLNKLSTEYISDELLKRHGDNVWRMRLRKNWLYLLLLVEFQSTDDPLMALRIHT